MPKASGGMRVELGPGVRRLMLAALAVGLLSAGPAAACNVPVFRYALERWDAAPYEVWVFNRGPLSAEHEKAIGPLKGDVAADHIDLHVIDIAAPSDAAKAGRVGAERPPYNADFLPWMVVRYPEWFEIPEPILAGPLASGAAAAIADSPARRQIARRIIDGDSAVFLILEGGSREKDDAAARLLETELTRLAAELKLPVDDDDDLSEPDAGMPGNSPPVVRIAFSTLRISRTDPAEQGLVRMLVGGWPKLAETTDPIVFPVFGRGRALCAMAGDRITADNITDICEFLTGPCSCTVKDQNPGVDLLMVVDWDGALAGRESAIPQVEPPPVTGVSAFIPGPAAQGTLLRNVWFAVGGAAVLLLGAMVLWRVLARRQ